MDKYKEQLFETDDNSFLECINNLRYDEIEEFFDLETRQKLKNVALNSVEENGMFLRKNMLYKWFKDLPEKYLNKVYEKVDLDFLFLSDKFCNANFKSLNFENRLRLFKKLFDYKGKPETPKLNESASASLKQMGEVLLNSRRSGATKEQLKELSSYLKSNAGVRDYLKTIAEKMDDLFFCGEEIIDGLYVSAEQLDVEKLVKEAKRGIETLPKRLLTKEFSYAVARECFSKPDGFSLFYHNLERKNKDFAESVYKRLKELCDYTAGVKGVTKQQFCVRFFKDDYIRVKENLNMLKSSGSLTEDPKVGALYEVAKLLKKEGNINYRSYYVVKTYYDDYSKLDCYKELLKEAKLKFGKELASSLTKVKDLDYVKDSKDAELKVHYFKGEDFNLLIHVTDKNAKEAKRDWVNDAKGAGKVISLSVINQGFWGRYKTKENPVVLGFENIEPEGIVHALAADSFSSANIDKTQPGLVTNAVPSYRPLKDFVDHTKNFNEIVYKQRFRGKVLKPSYVVAIDKISNKEREFAKEFKIPILKLDSSMYLTEDREYLTKAETEGRDFVEFRPY